ncbi:ribonuclease [Bacillus sp. AFS076308]|uniref:YlzJ-like family protein n=1 Tax=unclassified Bacillus (in: firmicutes) TaxID=185979 RepID=UPI000BF7457E|nr:MULTISPECIES: YlzJ-like family protein [unclassified Bacillus (in: firmicutes)]PFO05864.1 ribonuclease [Bacillus sp. AFS076308]PGV54109.1 ribonuclease [Bacillus sp. AFS037270]
MILYTMMPSELIFPSEQTEESKQKFITYQGVSMLVEQTDSDHVQVVRILSSDPQHYLNQQLCPGAKISFANLGGLSAL